MGFLSPPTSLSSSQHRTADRVQALLRTIVCKNVLGGGGYIVRDDELHVQRRLEEGHLHWPVTGFALQFFQVALRVSRGVRCPEYQTCCLTLHMRGCDLRPRVIEEW